MSEGLQQPSITAPPPVLHSPSSHSVHPTIQTEEAGDSPEPLNDSQLPSPTSSMTQSPDPLAVSQKNLAPFHPSHRRANTEIIQRQVPLLPNQARALDDLGNTGRFSRLSSESATKRRFGESARFLADWFHGKSEPVNLSAFRGARETDEMQEYSTADRRREKSLPPIPSESSMRAQRRAPPPSPLKQVTTPSRFSFFGLRRQDGNKSELPEPADDEFLNLDIAAVLSPPGLADLLPEDALDVIQKNAENVLKRLQAAYKQRTFSLHEVLAEKNERQEELEEARVQSGNLKSQLDGMADKVFEQEKAMKAMAEELERERQARRKEDEAHRRSVASLAKPADCDSISDLGADLQTSKRSFKRASNCTFTSDSGFESGDESIAESVFSRRDGIESPVSLTLPSPNMSQIALASPGQMMQKEAKAPVRPARQSAYDRVIKGLASSSLANSLMGHSSKCNICHGVPASEAWTVLGILKEENHGLKERLVELENAVDDCLCLVGP